MGKGLHCPCCHMSQQAADRSREEGRVTLRSEGEQGLDPGQGRDSRMQPSLRAVSPYLERAGPSPLSLRALPVREVRLGGSVG